MCGIVGAVASRPITQLLVDGLKRLEYRGYDSAGIAVIDQFNKLQCLRTKGKVAELEKALQQQPLTAHIGIAHTRWATHGAPSERNAHPLVSNGEFALVHNGIIENHVHLRNKLIREGYHFESETDSETVVHLIHYYYQSHPELLTAVLRAIKDLQGAYAVCVFSIHDPQRIIAVCHGAPLVIGKGTAENFVASDSLALLSYTQDIIYLENNDIVDLRANKFTVFDQNGIPVIRKIHPVAEMSVVAERGEYRHFMLKEIMEQPKAIADCLEGRMNATHLPPIFAANLERIIPEISHIQLVACGTSFHAGLVAKYWLETLTNIPCTVEVASEFRYRKVATYKNSLYVTLSQSGETADSLAALQLAKNMPYLHRLVITNVNRSAMARDADSFFLTHAGIEIGVASTKAFLTQLMALFLLVLTIRQIRNQQTTWDHSLIAACTTMPNLLQAILKTNNKIAEWASYFINKSDALFLGRGNLYPIALEGALKLKEISYIHAEGYPAGELKHGVLALIDANMPVIALVAKDECVEKILSNLHEVKARDGKLFIFADESIVPSIAIAGAQIIELPSVPSPLSPFGYSVPLQLLAYHVAVQKGTDVDQPRNLAKSVTVE